MGFLSGPVSFQCFQIEGDGAPAPGRRQFGPAEIKILQKFAISEIAASAEQPGVGFLGGDHLLDLAFSLEKNVIGEALHCGIRVDTHQIPAAVRKAWLQLELAALTAENPDSRPTKLQRQEAREAVDARCEDEIRSGRFLRMTQFPVLWDARHGVVYFGGASSTAADLCCDLFSQAFGIELQRMTASRRALQWATETKHRKALEQTIPSAFHTSNATAEVSWWNQQEGNWDFLGNEFLLWLWWRWETVSDTFALPDNSEVTGMFARTLSLQCPRDESGKETITAEGPTGLPEAMQAIRSGKLPRKAGMTLVRQGEQYDLAIQPEGFVISGAKILVEEAVADRGAREDRIESVRSLHETVDLMFRAFCEQRVGKNWHGEQEQIGRWLKSETARRKSPAA
jgi:hypothetical protein